MKPIAVLIAILRKACVDGTTTGTPPTNGNYPRVPRQMPILVRDLVALFVVGIGHTRLSFALVIK